MGKKYVGDCVLAEPLHSTIDFEELIKSLFAGKTLMRLVINGYKAVLRFRITSISPSGSITLGTIGTEVQSIIELRRGKDLVVSTEYGYHGSGGSTFRQGQAGQRFILETIEKYNETVGVTAIPEIKEVKETKQEIKDIPSQIIEMKKLQEQGIITEEEFVAFKKKLLDSI